MLHSSQIRIPFTKDAYEKIQKEFDRLTELRKEVIIRLQIAREQGDLSENGAYKYAKFELGDIGRKLRDLSYQLKHGVITNKSANSESIDFGAEITLKNSDREMTFMLVSEYESDPLKNKLSTKSPIGQAVIGKKKGDQITVQTPGGVVEWEIVEVG